MAHRDAFRFAVTVPAGTPIATPVTVATNFPPRIVRQIRWRVPPGAAGLVGFRITSGGAQILPVALGTWIIAAGEAETLPVDGAHDSGRWDITAYNTGVFAHTIHVTYHTEAIVPVRLPPARIPNDALSDFPGADANLWLAGLWG